MAVPSTPLHAQAPDVDAARRLLDALVAHGLDTDTAPLERSAAEV
jgi:hypothetical protein